MRTQERPVQLSDKNGPAIQPDRNQSKKWEGVNGLLIAVAAFICVLSFFSTTSHAGLNQVIVCKTMADVNKLVDLQVEDKKAASAFAYKLGRQSRCTLMRIMFPTTDYVDSLEYYRKDGQTIYGTANITLKSGGKVYALIVAHVDVAEPKKVGV